LSHTEDLEIIELILHQGKPDEGFRLLVKKYKERIYRVVRGMIFSHEDANDISQEIFIKIYHNLNKFQGEAKLYTWIYRICINECLTFLRKQKRNRVESTDPSEMPLHNAVTSQMDGEAAEKILWQAIDNLPDKQKLVFKLRYFEEMPYHDMSDILRTSEGALKASYHHAVKKIEKYIDERETRY
jgi:RNA polymerase sigma-70 factor, ECF subfamily